MRSRWSKGTDQERFFTNNWYIWFCQFLYTCPTNHTTPSFNFKSWNVICGKLEDRFEKKEQKIIDWKGSENYKTECRKWGAQRRKKTSLKTKRRNQTVIWERRKDDCSIFNYKRCAQTHCKRTQVNQSTLTPNLLYFISPTNKCEGEYKSFQNIYIFTAQAWNVIDNRNLGLEYDPPMPYLSPQVTENLLVT